MTRTVRRGERERERYLGRGEKIQGQGSGYSRAVSGRRINARRPNPPIFFFKRVKIKNRGTLAKEISNEPD